MCNIHVQFDLALQVWFSIYSVRLYVGYGSE